jgi:hypothetical protein
MNEDEIKPDLRRFRLVGRRPAVRAPNVRPANDRVVPASAWMPTAAVLIAATVLYGLSAYERAVVRVNGDHATVARAANVELVARILGGGPQSLLVATTVVLLDEPKEESR